MTVVHKRRLFQKILQPTVRFWLYGVAAAANGVLGAYGIVADDKISYINFFLAAVFGLSMGNVPRGSTELIEQQVVETVPPAEPINKKEYDGISVEESPYGN